MLRNFHDKKAQMSVGEYALTFFLVVAVVLAMSVMFRRVVQARIHDTRDYMVNYVVQNTGPHYDGNLYLWYEPYYMNIVSNTDTIGVTRRSLGAGGSSGIYGSTINQETRVQAISNTAVPRLYRQNLPGG